MSISDGMDNLFACFGSSSDDESDVHNNVQDHHGAGQRLKDAANIRRSNTPTAISTIDYNPIQSSAFEVYSCSDQFGYENGQFGMKANRAFEAGELIISENPVMRINTALAASSREEAKEKLNKIVQQVFDELSPMSAKSFMGLSSCKQQSDGDVKTPLGVFQTNCYQLDKDSGYGGIFLTISRMNHSCRPNVVHHWRPDLHRMNLYAIRDIIIGEELCTCYGPVDFFDTESRQEFLKEKYSFLCACEMCSEGNKYGGDNKMSEILDFHENISHMMSSPEKAKQQVENCLELLKKQGLGAAHLSPILHYGYQACVLGGENKLAQSYLERELISVRNSQGESSYRVFDIEKLLADMEA